MIDLLALADTLMKVKEVKDLLLQERLNIIIEFLEKVGEVQIKTAIEELKDAAQSTQPYKENDRAIGHLKVAAIALSESLQKRPFIKRVIGFDKTRRKNAYRQIAGCCLVITVLYRAQNNTALAMEYASKAVEAFEDYARIEQEILRKFYATEFTYNGGTDQAPLVLVIDSPNLHRLMKRYGLAGELPDLAIFNKIAYAQLEEERDKLFGWLNLPNQLR